MSTLEQHNEQLTIQKLQLQQVAQARQALIGALVLAFGEKKKEGYELRLTKSQRQAVEGHFVDIQPSGKDGLKVTVTEIEE